MSRLRKGEVVYKTLNYSHSRSLGSKSTKGQRKSPKTILKSDSNVGKTYQFVGTKEIIDRDGDIVKIDGMDFSNFKNNPVVLWGHDAGQLPIGRVVGLYHYEEEKELVFEIKFGRTEFAKEVELLVEDGILNTTSIGFIVKDWDYNELEEAYELTKTELFEISIVNVPANPAATAVKESEEPVKNKSISKEEVMEMIQESIAQAMAQKEEPEEPKKEEPNKVSEEEEVPAEEPKKDPEQEDKEEEEVKEEQPQENTTDTDRIVEAILQMQEALIVRLDESNKPAEQQEENTEADSQEPEVEPKESETNQQTDEDSSDEKQDEDHSKESPETPEETDEEESVVVEDLEDIEEDDIVFVIQ